MASVPLDECKGIAVEYSREEQCTPWSFDPPSASVVARYAGANLAIHVHGEADRYAAGRLLAKLLSALRPDLESVRVDLTDLSFCDLAGSDALHAFVDEASSRGIHVELQGMSTLLSLVYTTYPPCPERLAEDVLVGSQPT